MLNAFKTPAELRRYMMDGVRFVCENYKNRLPGTQSERGAQAFFKKELEQYADRVISEEFKLHPGAFMGFIPIAAVITMISVAIYWLNESSVLLSALAVLLPLLAALMFVFEFLLYRSFVDFLFPKKTSVNVYASYRPQGEVKRRIIFGGHTDAANEWRFSYLGGIYGMAVVMGGSIPSIFVVLGISVAKLVAAFGGGVPENEGIWKLFGIIALCLMPFAVAILFFINYRIVVDGANDNLSANYIAMSVIKHMKDTGFRFANTEVGVLLSGSEEAGLRGAKAFAKKHRDELLQEETVFISMDTMREISQLMVYTQGCTGTVRDDEAVGDLIALAGKNCGVDMPRAGIYPGACDSEAFTMYGLRAAGFNGVNHNPQRYYHTREDTPDNMDENCLALSLEICMEAARLFDEKGGMAEFDHARKGRT